MYALNTHNSYHLINSRIAKFSRDHWCLQACVTIPQRHADDHMHTSACHICTLQQQSSLSCHATVAQCAISTLHTGNSQYAIATQTSFQLALDWPTALVLMRQTPALTC